MKALMLLALSIAFSAQTGPSVRYFGKDREFALENMTPEGINVDFGKESIHAIGHGTPAMAHMLHQGATLAGNQLDVAAVKNLAGQYEIQTASAIGDAFVEFDSSKAAEFQVTHKLPPIEAETNETTKCTTSQFTYAATAGVGTLTLREAFHITDQQDGPIKATPKLPEGTFTQKTTLDGNRGTVTVNASPGKVKNRIRTANLTGAIHIISNRTEQLKGLAASKRFLDATADRATLDLTKVPGELVAEGNVKVRLDEGVVTSLTGSDKTSTMEFERLVLTLDADGKILSMSATGTPTKTTYQEKPKGR